ncbi:MAG: carboxypeptidase-like regulatory domain-containing protein [Bacteroidales bacterium]
MIRPFVSFFMGAIPLSLLLCITSCTKEEIRPANLTGNIEFKITTLNEFIQRNSEKEGILISLEGSDPVVSVVTDTSGTGIFKDMKIGNYRFLFSKSGYSSRTATIKGFWGAEENLKYSLYMIEKSTTRAEIDTLYISNGYLYGSGTLEHNYSSNQSAYPYGWPRLVAFLSNSPEVSFLNFKTYALFYASQESKNNFTFRENTLSFKSGSTVYVVIYGRNSDNLQEYDPVSDVYYDPALGVPSKIKSIVLP